MKRLDTLDAKLLRLEYMKAHYPALADLASRELFMFCLWAEQMTFKCLHGEERKQCEEKICNTWSVVRDTAPQTTKERIWMTLARHSFRRTAILRTALGIGM